MNEKLDLLKKAAERYYYNSEWFILYVIKAKVLDPAPVPEDKVSALSCWRVMV